jgi:hypothetical protein
VTVLSESVLGKYWWVSLNATVQQMVVVEQDNSYFKIPWVKPRSNEDESWQSCIVTGNISNSRLTK